MATITNAQLLAAGAVLGAIDKPGTPGECVIEWQHSGAKRIAAATDIFEFFPIPAFCGLIVVAAALEVIKPTAAAATLDLGIGGTDMTTATAWALNAAAGTKLIKYITGANTVTSSGSIQQLTAQINSQAFDAGAEFKLRVFGTLIAI